MIRRSLILRERWLQVGPDGLVQSEPQAFPPVGHHRHAALGLLQPELVFSEGLGGDVQQVLPGGAPDDVGVHHARKPLYAERREIHAGVDLGIRGLLVEGLGTLVLQVFLVPILGHEDVHGDPLVHLGDGIRECLHLVEDGLHGQGTDVHRVDRGGIHTGLQQFFESVHSGSVHAGNAGSGSGIHPVEVFQQFHIPVDLFLVVLLDHPLNQGPFLPVHVVHGQKSQPRGLDVVGIELIVNLVVEDPDFIRDEGDAPLLGEGLLKRLNQRVERGVGETEDRVVRLHGGAILGEFPALGQEPQDPALVLPRVFIVGSEFGNNTRDINAHGVDLCFKGSCQCPGYGEVS